MAEKSGDIGEREIVDLIPCPNCGKQLMLLPKNYPLYDIQCTACSFRVQVKTNKSKPKKEIFGAGWEIMNKVMKAGYMVPPLIINYKWQENEKPHQKILFYPFIPKVNLKKRQLPPHAKRANYKMFNYTELHKLPHFILFETDDS